uniref:Conserved oligomeric Golgi complex subunit 7-like n=1 Tax=Rhizophora mucronata TaxID=61149 RepID=A0A2P2KDS6_RHIMU
MLQGLENDRLTEQKAHYSNIRYQHTAVAPHDLLRTECPATVPSKGQWHPRQPTNE